MCRFFFRRRGLVASVVAFFLGFSCWFWWVWLGDVGVLFVNSIVCLFFCFYACFLFLSIFWLGLLATFVVGFPGLLFLQFCSESLILAQDERWRRA